MDLLEKGKIETANIVENIKKKKLLSRYLILIIAQFISAAYFNLLQLPSKIITGGSAGVSIIVNSYFKIDPSLVVLIVSVSLLIIGFIFLGIEKASGAVVATLVYPLFIKLTENIGDFIEIDFQDTILIAVFIGVLMGFAVGLVYKAGFSNGGISIISEIISKYAKLSISKVSFFINLIIVIIGGASFGWTMVMYSMIVLYIYSIVLDRVVIGVSKNKALYIITEEEEAIEKYILENIKHGITEYDVKGGFLSKKRKVIMTVIPNREYFKLKEGIKEIDKKAFFIVTDAYQVYGGN